MSIDSLSNNGVQLKIVYECNIFCPQASDQPSRPRELIRRITSESPNNNESPFFNPSGSKMKPLARLTLLRQRLYEKNCTAEQSGE